MISAAGILFIAPDNQALFVKRAPTSDFPGTWCIPGGTTEGDELPEDTAIREAREEIGEYPKGTLFELTRSKSEEVDFTTFRQRVEHTFEPTLNNEHVGFAWAPTSQPPEPLHPGCRVALDRLTMDELGVARAIAAGTLTSPQRYENMSLFAMRISGTGASYRSNGDEYVWRSPDVYLSDEMMARCNGLPVIWEHPGKTLLNSKEFSDRVIGTILLPYIKGDELWGVARIYDEEAIEMMETAQLSTSPAVSFTDLSVNSKLKMEDGKTLLIEGKPSLIDHLAVCERGVWDKGGPPVGIETVEIRSDSDVALSESPKGNITMTEEEKKALADAEKAKKDADESKEKEEKEKADAAAKADKAKADATLDKILSCVDAMSSKFDSLSSRMDAFEKKDPEDDDKKADKKKDADGDPDKDEPKELVADKKKKDSDEEDDKKEKADKAKGDSELHAALAEQRKMIAELQAKMPKQLSDADHAKMATAQGDADRVYQAFGDSAPRPLDGEDLLSYEKRLVAGLKKNSTQWKEIDIHRLDENTFAIAKNAVYADSMHVAMHPVDLQPGQLREITTIDRLTGQRQTKFAGTSTIFAQLKRPSRRVTHIGLQRGN